MIRDFEIDVLRAFVAVADTGGFTSAARHLNRTQSAVSMRVRRLEDFLGKRVFDRNGRGVRLTSDGEVLLRHARSMLKLNEEAVSDLIRPEVGGVVRIALPDGYGTYFLPRVLSSFAHAHPRIELEIDCGLTDDIAAALSEGRLDLALVVREPDDPRGEFLWAEPIDWVVSDKHDVYMEDPLPLALFQHGCVLRARALKVLDASGRKWRIAYCSVSLAAIQAAVLSGLAVGVVGHSAVLPDMRVLGPEDGFAALPQSEIELRRAPVDLSVAAKHLADHIGQNLKRSEHTSR